jgi:hypothetical protein
MAGYLVVPLDEPSDPHPKLFFAAPEGAISRSVQRTDGADDVQEA